MNRDALARTRVLLFVPGHRPERFGKAARAAGDAIVLDLEDAVAPEDKDTARGNVSRWLESGGVGVVRINGRGTPWHDADVELVGRYDRAVMLPKAESPEDIAALADRLPRGNGVVPLVETATGVLGARGVCAAPGVVRPAFGGVDLAAQLGVDPGDRTALLHARSALVLAAASAGVAAPLDGVTTNVEDHAVAVTDAEHAARLGFTGKLCVHPRQVEPVRAAFAPSAEALRWAEAVVATAGGGVGTLDGQMIDKPVVERARRLLDG
ncbi:HpcH/HpaI aldolase/citrate lyase family protein [Streptosporangium sp. V21-05]|uniref:HpcH/HpaI aldolase/citrate lyase family protein n=1 Tax=Streptosporangium sp. V21-05 TaxID=3446115 RepID=UPI003F52FB44